MFCPSFAMILTRTFPGSAREAARGIITESAAALEPDFDKTERAWPS